MRHGLKRPGLVLTPDREPKLRAQRVGLLNQLFFYGGKVSCMAWLSKLAR
jgi:hypothetical protein